MSNINIEICIDNLESLHSAIKGGASRIELCSSLALGGLTPSYGMMKKAAQISSVPAYVMIRPRQGDFLYDSDDIESMLEDIYAARNSGLQGVVFGLLTQEGKVDLDTGRQLMKAASGLGVTFHRAIDQCSDYKEAIENIKELGCERILTSGLCPSAPQGIDTIRDMVALAEDKFSVMAGAGITAKNAKEIVLKTGVRELHLSAKTVRNSYMNTFSLAKMGAENIDDYKIPVTSTENIAELLNSLNSLS